MSKPKPGFGQRTAAAYVKSEDPDHTLFLQPNHKYGLGVSWSHESTRCDLDIQAIIVDQKGFIIDAVYANNMSAMGGSIVHLGEHSAEHAKAAEAHSDGCIWVDPAKLPADVSLVIFVVSVHRRTGQVQHLKESKYDEVQLLKDQMGCVIQNFRIQHTSADVSIVCMIKRHNDGMLSIRPVEDRVYEGSHMLDIIEPNIGNLIRKHIRKAPAYQQVSFVMDKGAVMEFAEADHLQRVSICVGGNIPEEVEYDVEIFAAGIFLDKDGNIIGHVDQNDDDAPTFGMRASDVTHMNEKPDDEVLSINLNAIPAMVSQIFLVLNVSEGTFDLCESLYVAILDQESNELFVFEDAHHVTEHSGETKNSGLVVARLYRPEPGRFGFQSIGRYCTGHDWSESEKTIKTIFTKTPKEFHGETLPFADEGMSTVKKEDEKHLDHQAFLHKKIQEMQKLEEAREAAKPKVASVDEEEEYGEEEEGVYMPDGAASSPVADGTPSSSPAFSRMLSSNNMHAVRSGSRLATISRTRSMGRTFSNMRMGSSGNLETSPMGGRSSTMGKRNSVTLSKTKSFRVSVKPGEKSSQDLGKLAVDGDTPQAADEKRTDIPDFSPKADEIVGLGEGVDAKVEGANPCRCGVFCA